MSLASNLQTAFVRVATEFKTMRVYISGTGGGDVSGLRTDATNLVGAINELFDRPVGGDGGGTGEPVPTELDDLTDVRVLDPATGHLLRYDGMEWINVPGEDYYLPDTARLGDLEDVDTDFLENGYILKYSNDSWGGAFDYGRLVYNNDNIMRLLATNKKFSPYFLENLIELSNLAELQQRLELAAVALSGSASDLTTGTLPTSVLPALAIIDVHVVTSEPAMLALEAQQGDVAVRSDISRTFILASEPASDLTNWVELPSVGDIVSVNGQQGVVNLTFADVGAQQVDATLSALAGLATAADQLIYATGPDAFATAPLTAFGRSLAAAADAPAARGLLSVYSQAEIGDIANVDFVGDFETALQ